MRTRVRPGRRGVAADSTSDRTTAPGPRSPLKAFLPQLIDIFIPLGVYFLGSLFMGRSFFYYIVRKFVAGSDEEAKVKWERAWGDSKEFRHTLRVFTMVWGVGFVAEALVRLVLVYELPVSTMVIVSPVLSVVLFVVLVIFSRVYGKRVGRAFRGESSARA